MDQVNLAAVDDVATRKRLLRMARKLLRFMTLLALVAIVLGNRLLGRGAVKSAGWMHAKLGLVALLIGYQPWCALLCAGSGGSTKRLCCCAQESSRWPSSNRSEDAI